MKLFRLHSSVRLVTLALLMFSWIIATNHCAFGLMKPTAQAETEHSRCCSSQSAPEKNSPPDGGRECCKSIHGAPVPAKVEVKFDGADFQLQVFALLQVLAPRATAQTQASLVFDHGPPRSISFAESVLQRSLLGHAPPFV